MDPILKSQVATFQVQLFAALAGLNKQLIDLCTPLLSLSKREFVAHVQQHAAQFPPKVSLFCIACSWAYVASKALCFAIFDAIKDGQGMQCHLLSLAWFC
jgi:hypothetical protein